jgi:hypothetical protein
VIETASAERQMLPHQFAQMDFLPERPKRKWINPLLLKFSSSLKFHRKDFIDTAVSASG